jgi:hypothetical protein|tara:strand:- start:243 stop:428 length:186 start_codon:yes stop_codon:yes gene_type:complete
MSDKKDKGRKWDGRSRVSNDLYRENFEKIFGKKLSKDEELEGYYIDGYDDKNSKVLIKKKQ